jgi:hypothetical protein
MPAFGHSCSHWTSSAGACCCSVIDIMGACSGLMIYNLLIAPLSLNPGNWLMDRAAVRHDTGSLVLVFVA